MKHIIKAIFTFGLLVSILLTTGGFVAKASTSSSKEKELFTVSGRMFTYEDAPELARQEHKQNCDALGIQPSNTDPIYIPVEGFERYGLRMTRSGYDDFIISSNGSTIYMHNAMGTTRDYSVSIYTYVGYNYVTSGDAVVCLQIFLNRFNNNLGLAVDGLFGPNTHAQLIRFQDYANLSTDAICGPNTWRAFLSRYSGA